MSEVPGRVWCVAACILATGCGGGGGGRSSIAVPVVVPVGLHFDVPAQQGTEGGTIPVRVTLDLLDPPLTEPVTFRLVDTGSGTATAGRDYGVLDPLELDFPVGSQDGEWISTDLSIYQDLAVEGAPETIELELVDVTGGAVLTGGKMVGTILDDDFATFNFSEATTVVSEEGSSGTDLTVRMALAPGALLAVDVGASIASTGTASPGTDFQLSTTHVVFPAGSNHGAAVNVHVGIVDDPFLEGEESAVLSLVDPSPGVVFGILSKETLTIFDSDVSQAPFLEVRAGGAKIGPGAPIAFAAPGSETVLEVANLGQAPMMVTPLTLTGSTRDFAVETMSSGSIALTVEPAVEDFPFTLVREDGPLGCVLGADTAAMEALASRDRVTLRNVPLPERPSVDLRLERMPAPVTEDAVLEVDGVRRPFELDPALSLWKGTVDGRDESTVFLALNGERSRGWIDFGDERVHLVPVDKDTGVELRLVASDVLEGSLTRTPTICSSAPSVPGAPGGDTSTSALVLPSFQPAVCRLAIESDYEYFTLFPDVPQATSYAVELIAAVSNRFEVDAQTSLAIAYLGIHSEPDDPWETTGQTLEDVLTAFKNAWAPNHWPASAHLAHFLSGAPLGGGVAYVDAICNTSFGFAVSASVKGWIDWSTFQGTPSVLNWDFIVVAHEIGHGFGAMHTQDYCPPLDQCAASCAPDGIICAPGTLMSYCHICAANLTAIRLRFHPHVANVMRARSANSCLGVSSLDGQSSVRFTLRYEPSGATEAHTATLGFGHGAPNAPTPFNMALSGD